MLYLLHVHWLWIFGAVALGIIVGWMTHLPHRVRWTDRWVRIVAALVVIATVIALTRLVPGRPGYWLELASAFSIVYFVGCFIGWALRDVADFQVVEAVGAADTSYLFRHQFAGLAGAGAYLRQAGASGANQAVPARPLFGSYVAGQLNIPRSGYVFPVAPSAGVEALLRGDRTPAGQIKHWTHRGTGSEAPTNPGATGYRFADDPFNAIKGGYVFPSETVPSPIGAAERQGRTSTGMLRHWTWAGAAQKDAAASTARVAAKPAEVRAALATPVFSSPSRPSIAAGGYEGAKGSTPPTETAGGSGVAATADRAVAGSAGAPPRQADATGATAAAHRSRSGVISGASTTAPTGSVSSPIGRSTSAPGATSADRSDAKPSIGGSAAPAAPPAEVSAPKAAPGGAPTASATAAGASSAEPRPGTTTASTPAGSAASGAQSPSPASNAPDSPPGAAGGATPAVSPTATPPAASAPKAAPAASQSSSAPATGASGTVPPSSTTTASTPVGGAASGARSPSPDSNAPGSPTSVAGAAGGAQSGAADPTAGAPSSMPTGANATPASSPAVGASQPKSTPGSRPAGTEMPGSAGGGSSSASGPTTPGQAGADKGATSASAQSGPSEGRVPTSAATAGASAGTSVQAPAAGAAQAGGAAAPSPGISSSATPGAGMADPPKIQSLPNEDLHPGERPEGLVAARDNRADDLKWIKGIGPQNEGRLHGLGVWHFDQIAAWTPDNVKWVGSYLAFHGRIDREKWIEQATQLAGGETTEFAKRVASGKVSTSRDDGGHGQSNVDANVLSRPRKR